MDQPNLSSSSVGTKMWSGEFAIPVESPSRVHGNSPRNQKMTFKENINGNGIKFPSPIMEQK